ncbi:MAG: hypothetical protein GTO18_15375 [Anaerolineales bacterium]|nr:hypothetical protein [Anaerolineales bacterium]
MSSRPLGGTFAVAVGHLGFGTLRLIFLSAMRDDIVWFVFWEESTELILIVAILYLVWVIRSDLLKRTPGIDRAVT